MEDRTDFPRNDGTTIPPCSTSTTTVPVVGLGTGELAGEGDVDRAVLSAGARVSVCRIAAATTVPDAVSPDTGEGLKFCCGFESASVSAAGWISSMPSPG